MSNRTFKVFGIQADKPTPNGNVYPADVLKKMAAEMPHGLKVVLGQYDGSKPVDRREIVGFVKDAEFVDSCLNVTAFLFREQSLKGRRLCIELGLEGAGKCREITIGSKRVRLVEEVTVNSFNLVDEDGKTIEPEEDAKP